LNSSLTSTFLHRFAALPPDVQALARKNYKLWTKDPAHPSLRFKRVGKRTESYSVRIGLGWRALGVKSGDAIVWFWIGSHSDYDRLVETL
jgi:hypothetical protein